MRMGEANTVAPMTSLELPPATSYAVVPSSSPVCRAVLWDPLVSHRAQAGAGLGRSEFWATLARALWAAESIRAGPAVGLGFHFCFVYPFSQICVYIQKCVSPSW